jgi:hypothetical protein
MKKGYLLLIIGLIFLSAVSIVSAAEPRCIPSLNGPNSVMSGSPVFFLGSIDLHGPVNPLIYQGNQIQIYKSSFPGIGFMRWNMPTLVGTSKTMKQGQYIMKYTPSETAYYQAWCTYAGEQKVTSWHSPWIKVIVDKKTITPRLT